jgi:tRNA threonylcarbamoyladenosine biosynthesis protein TsaB
MRILGFDLSSRLGSIACSPAVQREWPNDRRNSAPFFQALDEMIRAHGLPEIIVVGVGPGSYTGTRIAISAAIGLQLTSGAQLLGLPSICAMSAEDDYAVIGDAKRASFFFARITSGNIAGEIELLSDHEVAQIIGETILPIYSADEMPQFDRVQLGFPRAELLCRFAQTSENVVRAPLDPIYLRAPHITTPRLART